MVSTALYMTAAESERGVAGALTSIKNASANYLIRDDVLFIAVIL
jgi:hypothetical protein